MIIYGGRLTVHASIVAALAMCKSAQDPLSGSAPAVEQGWSIVAGAGWTGILSAVEGSEPLTRNLVVRPLNPSTGTLLPEPSRLIMPVCAPVVSSVHGTGLQLSDGRWAFVVEANGGGARVLEYAEVRGDIAHAMVGEKPLHPDLPEIIHGVDVDGSHEQKTLAYDLLSPSLIENAGRVFIVACARIGDNVGAGITWIGAADIRGNRLDVTPICAGVDPRIARLNSRYYCAVREVKASETLADPAPVSIYASEDLMTWKPVPSPDSSWSVSSLDCVADKDLWLFGIRTGDGNSALTGQILRFEGEHNKWTVAASLPLSSGTTARLVPANGQGIPRLLLRETSGAMMYRSVAIR